MNDAPFRPASAAPEAAARPDYAARRAKAERMGRQAEAVAALYLQLRGFSILARRFKAAGGEIDLAARRGKLLVLAEVKVRASLDEAILAVPPRSRRRIEAAGRAFLAFRPQLAALDLRYDILSVKGLSVRHLPDAWRASS
jgi:putative endonuclease